MPYTTSKAAYKDPFLDKRTKLLPCQKEMVIYWRERGLSQRELARMFHVSRRLITFVTDPQKQEQCMVRRLERGGSKQYYDKDKWPETMRKHRQRKHKILKDTIK